MSTAIRRATAARAGRAARAALRVAATLGILVVVVAPPAAADPLRLRADALVQSQAPAPVGLVVLHGEDRVRPWLDAETVAWLGVTQAPGATGDVLSLSVRMRDQKSGSEVRVGRMLVATGALRPVHLDGVRAVGRVFGGTTAEAFAGIPVVPRFSYDGFGYTVGGRVAQTFSDVATIGGSYATRAHAGERADEEAGLDATFVPAPWLDAAARWAVDVVSPGTSEALASVSAHREDLRVELFSTYRSPSRILPSTSLFSVLGAIPSTLAGGTIRYRMVPRLELLGTANGQFQGSVVGGQAIVRATLALDDDFAGTIGVEGRRVDFGTSKWTGVRAVASKPLSRAFRIATEIELVVPDSPRGRGAVWPWALAAIGYRPTERWDVALAVEAASLPEYRAEANVLLRGTYALDGRGR